ncbi:FitA-like ribbon-helix-helix domain-containing protein [Muricoccus radiodurans]|uniref:FitA-like ribbon-helix-helix domain-containing protein n=1 Tax=Muricoccus radiodurans TaxID=2231721 RepID=UPI003CE73C42
MGQLLVRNVEDEIIARVKARPTGHGHSVDAERRQLLRDALLEGTDWRARRAAVIRRMAGTRAAMAGRDVTAFEVRQRESRGERPGDR